MKIITPKKRSVDVEHFEEIRTTAGHMQSFLESGEPGRTGFRKSSIALHHSQVDPDPANFFVIRRDVVGAKDNEICVVINPKIVELDKASKYTHLEGCLSFPFRHDKKVSRYGRVKVWYQTPDQNSETSFKDQEIWVEGFMAAIFQHECEHAKGNNIYQK